MRIVVAAVAAVLVSGCGGAVTSRVDSVARVGEYELSVQRLAELLATGKDLPVHREVVNGVSLLWVDYTLFADHLLAGDSLLDSARVAATMWADIQQEIASRFHDQLIGRAAQLDSAAVDSAYAAGNYRVLRHITFDVSPDASPNIRQMKRRVAEDTRAKLAGGGLTWAQAVQASDDQESRGRGGDLGVVARGEVPERVENAAFALAPGEISEVIETPRGYDIISRPPLADVRDEFRDGVEGRIEDRFDERYLDELPARWNLRVRSGIGPAVREVGRDPARAKESGKVLGSYRGGQFRVSDMSRWLQAMPGEVWQQLPAASDSQVAMMVQSLMRNEVLLREAKAAGVTVTPDFLLEVTDKLRRELALMGALLGFPSESLPAYRALPAAARRQLVETRVLGYLTAVSQNRQRLQVVPPFLADHLREEAKWRVVPAGVERVLERARQLRLALDTVPAASGGRAPVGPPAGTPAAQPSDTPPTQGTRGR